jgi:hypothetical protein
MSFGRDLTESELLSLNDEQRAQLAKLERESKAAVATALGTAGTAGGAGTDAAATGEQKLQ